MTAKEAFELGQRKAKLTEVIRIIEKLEEPYLQPEGVLSIRDYTNLQHLEEAKAGAEEVREGIERQIEEEGDD